MAKELVCEICGKKFDSKRGLKIHKGKVHKKEKPKKAVKKEKGKLVTIPLSKVKHKVPRGKRAQKAVKFLKESVARNMKVDTKSISIEKGVNELIWSKGIQKPPSKIKVAVSQEEGRVKVSLP